MGFWRRRTCPHYFEEFYEAADVYDPHDLPTPLRLPWTHREWLCVRGCGKSKVMPGDRIPWSHIQPGEVVLGNRLYGPTIPRQKPLLLP